MTATYATQEPVNGSPSSCGESCADDYYGECEECRDYCEPPHDYPVSADETIREYGRAGRRTSVRLWHAPGVKPKRATQGIRVGDTIATWCGTGVVTRVGTVAGFYIVDGQERRWDVSGIRRISVNGSN